ncbi:MAG: hypothetical protein ACI32O_06535 [Enterococcus sp.]|nr:hypothetical protein [Enterococcus sp. 10A9_DIV0425]
MTFGLRVTVDNSKADRNKEVFILIPSMMVSFLCEGAQLKKY